MEVSYACSSGAFMNLVKLCRLRAPLMEYLITGMSWQIWYTEWLSFAAILAAIEKQMNLPFVSTLSTSLYNLVLFIFILFYLFMNIKVASDQQFPGLDIMIISQRHHFVKIFLLAGKGNFSQR